MHSKKVSASPSARLVILEGNISAGKTSLAKALAQELGYQVFLEPTITNPYLAKYYAEPKKFALVMQIWLLKQRFRTYVTALQHLLTSGGGIILDRSVFSDWVFAEKNRIDGNIAPEGFLYYLELRKQMLQNLPLPTDLIYLDVSAEICLERVHKLRGRECESGIPIEYLRGLDQCYNAFLQYMNRKGTAVLRLDWNKFGFVQSVADALTRSPAAPVHEWTSRVESLRDLYVWSQFGHSLTARFVSVFSEDKVASLMQLPPAPHLALCFEEELSAQSKLRQQRADMENEAEFGTVH